jgi:hypothetical protein
MLIREVRCIGGQKYAGINQVDGLLYTMIPFPRDWEDFAKIANADENWKLSFGYEQKDWGNNMKNGMRSLDHLIWGGD